MNEEFNLSEKVLQFSKDEIPVYSEEDVKEFIKRLKEYVNVEPRFNRFQSNLIIKKIDKLAGKNLIEGEKEK